MEPKAELLLRRVATVSPSESIETVAQMMSQKHIGAAVVAEAGKVVGIFTERDMVIRVAAKGVDLRSTPVSEVMTPDPKTIEADEPLSEIFVLLGRRRFRHIPITRDGEPVGMVSLSDFAGVLNEVFSEPKYIQYFVEMLRTGSPGGAS